MSYKHIVLVFCLAVAVSAKIVKKIIGGRTTDITVVPYLVAVLFNDRHVCGGTIIDPSWILTAAHCIGKGKAENYTIRAGANTPYHDGEVAKVERKISHPSFRVNNPKFFDIALLELECPLDIGRKIKTIPLSKTEPQRGDQLLVSGWGFYKEEGLYPDYLQTVVVPVVSREKCHKIYFFSRPVTESMICAGFTKGQKGPCKGDSGGPAVFNKKLVGVVSWSWRCARKGLPAVYANVAAVKSWVELQMR